MRMLFGLIAGLTLSSVAQAEMRLAVVPFDNGGAAEFDQLGLGLQSMLSTDLSQDDQVTVVERSKLQTLVDEMGLAQSGVVDPVTAAKMGKALGATHMVSGTFVIVGDTMRLDARLIDVASGASEGASAEGEKEAFFELEKTLVKELLKVIGAELTPKERAAISRIHTADFESFSEYSKGVALFEADRYDEALAVLRKVSDTDADFKLAETTASAVRDAQKRAADKARAARVVEAEGAFVARQESARWEAEQLEGLRKVAFDPDATRADRVSAAMYLTTLTRKTNRGSFHELRYVTDNFALQRLGDRSFQVIWSLLDPEVPRWFPRYSGSVASINEERGWDAAYSITNTRKKIFESKHVSQTLADCKYATSLGSAERILEALWLPKVQTLDVWLDQVQRGAACDGVDPARIRDEERDIAEKYAREGEVAKAAAILDAQAKIATEARELEEITRELAQLAEHQAFLELAKTPEEQELVRFAPRASASDLQPERLPHMLHYRLRRDFPHDRLFFLNELPTWLLTRPPGLGSGPRIASDASRSLRFYGDTRNAYGFDRKLGEPLVAVLGGMAVRDGTFTVDLNWEPAAEWHPHASRPEGFTPLETAPLAGALVGIVDVRAPATCDPVDETKVEGHPLTAVAAFVKDGDLILGRVQGVSEISCRNTRSIEGMEVVEELAKRSVKKATGTLSVSVKGKEVTAKIGKTTVSTSLAQPVVGFYGLWAEGEGYVELLEPTWK